MYQLFGTAFITARAQSNLTNEFDASIATVRADDTTQIVFARLELLTISTVEETTTTIETQTSASRFENFTAAEIAAIGAIAYQPEGKAIAQIVAPEMGLDSIVVQGTSVSDLRNGPGHYTNSAALCGSGNASIAGHRTTYGSPFGDIANLEFGDEIVVHTVYGSCTYMVTKRFVVQPNETWVVKDQGDNRLTLTSCHPKYSASQRYVVVAQLVSTDTPYIPTQDEINQLISDTTETTIHSEDITTSEIVTSTVEVEVEVTEDIATDQDQDQDQDQENTVGAMDGFGTGLDGDSEQLFAVILYGLLFFAVWYRAYKTASYWNEHKGRKFKRYGYAAFAIPMIVTLSLFFYRLDLLLPSY
jgi:LPXTG-site transpeptidase (sortase) family protein